MEMKKSSSKDANLKVENNKSSASGSSAQRPTGAVNTRQRRFHLS